MHKSKIIKLNIMHINEKNTRKIVDNTKKHNYNEKHKHETFQATLKVKERREENEEGKTRSSACSEKKSVEANRKTLGVLCAAASRHHSDNYF